MNSSESSLGFSRNFLYWRAYSPSECSCKNVKGTLEEKVHRIRPLWLSTAVRDPSRPERIEIPGLVLTRFFSPKGSEFRISDSLLEFSLAGHKARAPLPAQFPKAETNHMIASTIFKLLGRVSMIVLNIINCLVKHFILFSLLLQL